MELIKIEDVNDKIILLRNQPILLDSDVAALYNVQTREINQAVKNNPDKFPIGYIFELDKKEKQEVATICGNPKVKFSPTLPNAFTKKVLNL